MSRVEELQSRVEALEKALEKATKEKEKEQAIKATEAQEDGGKTNRKPDKVS